MTTSDVSLRSGVDLEARSTAVHGPFDPLDHYAHDGFAWLDSDHGFVASGVAAVVAATDAAALLSTIDHQCDEDVSDRAGPLAVGAMPFTGTGDLVVPAVIVGRDAHGRAWRTVVGDPAAPLSAPPIESVPPSEFDVAAVTTREQWRAMVRASLADIDRGALEKVVLARAVRVIADRPFDVPALLGHLRRAQPGCIVYADRGFLGASPEILVRKIGASVMSRPLAGTGVDPAALAGSAKDGREHQLVVDAVVNALRTLCVDVRAVGPSPLELADVSHLATTVTATTEVANTSVVDLVAALHPTPAVAGTPRATALDAIAAMETVPRGRYAGPCGWLDRNGDGEFIVSLRGGEIDGAHALIHAGAGIVRGSDPDAEWAETQQKLTPMLQALVRP